MDNKNEIAVYQSKNGKIELGIMVEKNDIWLTQLQLAKLFNTTKQNIGQHIDHIFKEGELDKRSTVKESFTVQNEGGRNVKRGVSYYNLDAVISVGYRVNSKEGTRFRIWAREVIKEHITRGYSFEPNYRKEIDTKFDYLGERIESLNKIWRMTLGDTIPKQQLVDILKELKKDITEVKAHLGLDKKEKHKKLDNKPVR